MPNRVLFDAQFSPGALLSPVAGLWISDGTSAGTTQVKQGAGGTGFTQSGSQVLFAASDAAHGSELWVTDGTSAGTTLLKDINPGTTGGFVGSIPGSLNIPTSLRPAGTKMVFLGNDGVTGTELWVTDGTSAGTSLLKDIYVGSQTSNPEYFSAFGTKQLFSAFDGLHAAAGDGLTGRELWVTDGTAAGTSVLKDINPAINASSSPLTITDLGTGRALFSAFSGSASRELWVTDGTAAGTSLLKDINPGFYRPSNPGPATLVGTTGLAVFAAFTDATTTSTAHGTELWVTDGTAANTSRLKTFSGGYQGGNTSFLANSANSGSVTAFANKVLFIGTDAGATSLWSTDGTVGGTAKLSDMSLFASGPAFTQIGTKELFWNAAGSGPATPWVTDGTSGGTSQLKMLNTQVTQGQAYGFAAIGTKALFNAVAATGPTSGTHTLWITNGTTAGTYDIGVNLSDPKGFSVVGNKVFFQAADSVHGTELWVSDGTFSGTSLVKDINTGSNGQNSAFSNGNPTNIAAVTLACFAAGTHILASTGETKVEALREGDLVVTASGEHRPVRWIGHRVVDIARHPSPGDACPVCIAPHAFGPNQPRVALFLSPDHAIYAEGVLIPVKHLTNGQTIVQVPVNEITYYHVELSSHDIVLAEGLPVESYLDTGDRSNFANAGGPIRLFPDFSGAGRPGMLWEAYASAPLTVVGTEIETVRAMLAERAACAGSAAVAA